MFFLKIYIVCTKKAGENTLSPPSLHTQSCTFLQEGPSSSPPPAPSSVAPPPPSDLRAAKLHLQGTYPLQMKNLRTGESGAGKLVRAPRLPPEPSLLRHTLPQLHEDTAMFAHGAKPDQTPPAESGWKQGFLCNVDESLSDNC